MLRELRVSGLGVIKQAEVTLPAGLTVITGETGAGKTMLLAALGLLAGGRADSAVVEGASAQVSAVFELPPGHPVAQAAIRVGAALEDSELIAARRLTAAGRSRAHLGGVPVPSSVLADTVGWLVCVHGQGDQQRLRSPSQQRDLLDAFGGIDLTAYQALHDAAGAAHLRLRRWEDQDRRSAFEADSLARAIREIDAVAPRAGEEEDLPRLLERLSQAEDLRQAAERSLAALNGDDSGGPGGATALLEDARRALNAGAGRDPALGALAERAGELAYLVSDLAGEVAEYRLGLEADPAAVEALQERRAALNALLRRYGATAAEVIAFADQARERLGELDLSPERRAALAAEAERLTDERDQSASAIGARRRSSAAELERAVQAELAELGMAGARFEIQVEPLAEPGRQGADAVEFRFSAHGGGPTRPLAKGASGGELSRLMLALEVAALDGAPAAPAGPVACAETGASGAPGQAAPPRAGGGTPDGPLAEISADAAASLTLVFDEIDQGVGGQAALALAERLARLARGRQVILVTHLPQLAAAADHHLVVTKQDGVTTVDAVSGEGRQRELARMLAGLEESDAALEHAGELLSRDWVRQSSRLA
ncbi:MAG: DNA repair protein RecN [Bifidobacteriaceae bacterium]|jgi:DNA repair protein RecN (Recombination protein N)|nr:DNA repair protein RecN [Bifidobacteriaceae bacterium]